MSSMSGKLRDRLVEIQRSVCTCPLFTMRLETKLLAVGATPTTTRRIGIVPGGTFEGERLLGRVLDGGSDRSAATAVRFSTSGSTWRRRTFTDLHDLQRRPPRTARGHPAF